MSDLHLIDALDEPGITQEYVSNRVENWLTRLDALLGNIRRWAVANGWTVENHLPTPMHEELMERFEIPKREQPNLSVRSPQGAEIWIKPKGLWVIGANGRIDVFSPKGVYTLVDTADKFEPPHWVLHRVGHAEAQIFEPEQLLQMV